MTTEENGAWAVQVSVKSGPNQEVLTNVRGPDFATVAGHWAEGATFSKMHGDISTFLALGQLGAQFPNIQHVGTQQQAAAVPAQQRDESKPCPATAGKMHTLKRGVKNGKPWAGWLCDAKVCEPVWVD